MAVAVSAVACRAGPATPAALRIALVRSCTPGDRGEGLSSVTFGGAIPSTRGFLSSSDTVQHKTLSQIEYLPRPSPLQVKEKKIVHNYGCNTRLQQSGGTKRCIPVRCSQGPDSGTVTEAPQQGQQPASSKFVLVVGAAGGVGQLVVASLLEKGVKVRALIRNADKAKSLFGDIVGQQFEFRIRDTREREALDGSVTEGVTHVIIATGTSAFPSKRWFGDNGPKPTDFVGVRNVIDALPRTVERIVLVSSIGVTKPDELPYSFLNLFGVLKYKKMGEDYLRASGIPFTIIRPTRLTGAPYTSYDVNTLLKNTAGTRLDVLIGQGDQMGGEADRVMVAEACVQVLDLDFTTGQAYELSSVEGAGPGKEAKKWASLFEKARSPALKTT